MSNRIKDSLLFLKDGQSFSLDNLRIGMENADVVFVTGWTNYNYLENITQRIALEELEDIKETFSRVLKKSVELREFLLGKSIKYNLAYNYGMGSIGICSEKDGIIEWLADLK